MTLSQILDLVKTSREVTVRQPNGKEICERIYRIRWHHKDLLDKEVKYIVPGSMDEGMYIVLQGE